MLPELELPRLENDQDPEELLDCVTPGLDKLANLRTRRMEKIKKHIKSFEEAFATFKLREANWESNIL